MGQLVRPCGDGQGQVLKTELFAKAKAEAKMARAGAASEFSAKWGYDFGVDASIFGGRATFSVGLTLAGAKLKKGEAPKVTVLAFAPTSVYALTLPFESGGEKYNVEGSFEVSAELEPNWAVLTRDLVLEVGGAAAVDAALAGITIVGPIFIMGSGFLYASEKRELEAKLSEGAHDAKHAALVYATIMSGSDMPAGKGPRSAKAVSAATGELGRIAADQGVSRSSKPRSVVRGRMPLLDCTGRRGSRSLAPTTPMYARPSANGERSTGCFPSGHVRKMTSPPHSGRTARSSRAELGRIGHPRLPERPASGRRRSQAGVIRSRQ